MRVLTRSPLLIGALIVVGLLTIGPKLGTALRDESRRNVWLYAISAHPFDVTYIADDGLKGPFHVTKGKWGPRRVPVRFGVAVHLAMTPTYEPGAVRFAVDMECRITQGGHPNAAETPHSHRRSKQNTPLGCVFTPNQWIALPR
jgi:hypothetical protein